MLKKIWFLPFILLFNGCSDFMDAIDNFQPPAWETEISFHILEENLRIVDKISGDSFIAYDCTDTTLCDTSRGQIYMIEISDSIGTITVGDQLEFDDIHQEFEQSIDDIEINPVSTELITEIGTISLGEMEPQNTPVFTFRDIMPAETVTLADNAAGNSIIIPPVEIEQQEQIFSFSSFSEAEILSSTIDIQITNYMFITLGEPINIELKNIDTDETLGEVSFQNAISSNTSATETLNLDGTT